MDMFCLGEYTTTLVLGAICILCVYLFGRRTFSCFKDVGIPGPKPVSHFGNILQMHKKGFCNVFKLWREEYGDVYGIFMGVNPNFIISDPEIIQEVLVKRFSIFTNRTAFLSEEINDLTLPTTKDSHWKFLRAVLSPSFTAHQMREMNTMIQTCAGTLADNFGKLADSGEITEVKKLFSAYTIDAIAATGFGIMVDSQKNPNDPLVQKAKGIFDISVFSPVLLLFFFFPFANKLFNALNLGKSLLGNQIYFRKFCKILIDERKKVLKKDHMPKNLLNLMISAQLEGHEELDPGVEKELQLENMTDWKTKRGITDKEILAQCTIIFLAAYETTSSTLTFFTYLMSVNPEAQQKLYQEIVDVLGEELPTYDNLQQLPYLNMCLDETLRMFPIATALDRQASDTCVIKGIRIPAGRTIRIAVDALHYDPKYWPEPEKFIPERFSDENKSTQVPFTYLPFGGGPRVCIGMRLAKLEFKIAVVEIIRKFKIFPTEKTENPPEFSNTFLLAAKNGIWAKFERRQKA